MPDDSSLRNHLLELLRGGQAHTTFDDAVKDMPLNLAGVRHPGAPYSAWELLEHIRFAQKDILEFSRSADYVSPKWPEGYWPKSPAPAGAREWTGSVDAVLRDRAAFEALVKDPANDLYRKFPWGDGQTLLRETLLIADHTAYHVGQLVLVRRLLGAWPGA
jgi:DinB superfamily